MLDEPQEPDELQRLIADAKAVAGYGQRAGLFADSALFDAIQKAETKPGLSWADTEVVDLQAAMNQAVRQISPVTLVDLKGDWDPFGETRRKSSVLKLIYVAVAFTLLALCGYYTVWHNRSTQLLSEIAEARSEQQAAIMNEVFLWIVQNQQNGEPIDLGDVASPVNIAFTQKLDQLAQIHGRDLVLRMKLRQQNPASLSPVTSLYYRILAMVRRPPYDYTTPSAANASASASPTALPGPAGSTRVQFDAGGPAGTETPAGDPMAQKATTVFSSDRYSCPTTTYELSFEPLEAAGGEPLVTSDAIRTVYRFYQERHAAFERIRCIAGIRELGGPSAQQVEPASTLADSMAVYNLSQKTDVVGRWWLPGLYGALGAIVFTMRSLLNPIHPDPKPERVALRVSLGAFAGTSIAWFWTGSPAEGLNFASLSLGLLTIAFLFGFAIDVFFALLDRLVTLASGAVSKMGSNTA
jgi:hypothetical protein